MSYRRIWEEANGPIPDGHEIHHIDGDRSNNALSNLACLSLQEHYDVHYSQGDWGACSLLGRRLRHTPEELFEVQSKMASDNCRKQIENGTWHFNTPEMDEKRLASLRSSKKHKKHLSDLNERTLKSKTHSSFRKLSCLGCHKVVDISNFGRHHKLC